MGDLTDLSTGEKTAEDISFVTMAGSLTGERSEKNTKRWLSLRDNVMNSQLLNPLRKSDSKSGK